MTEVEIYAEIDAGLYDRVTDGLETGIDRSDDLYEIPVDSNVFLVLRRDI